MITLLQLVLGFASKLMGYLSDKQLLDAGEAKNAQQALQESRDALERARATSRRVRDDPEYRDSVRERFRDDGGA